MTTFTGWNDPNSLMHFRTKGSKNGVRRFQNEDGTWTPLGLRERKEREGWGDGEGTSRKARRAQRSLERAERHVARRQARDEARAAAAERKRKNSVKGLTDAELQKKIARLKMEQEYRELSKSPLLKTGEKLITSYFEGREKALDRQMKKDELVVKREEAKQKTIASKAALSQARGGIIDNVIRGSKYKQAQTNLINAKAENTIGGAMRKAIGKAISKEGDRFVSGMGKDSLILRGGRKVKSVINTSREKTVDALTKYYAKDQEELERRQKKRQKERDRKFGQQLRG